MHVEQFSFLLHFFLCQAQYQEIPIKSNANCATIHPSYPAGYQIPGDQNKTETQTKTHTHTHREYCPTDPLCSSSECSLGNVTAQQIRADSPDWRPGSKQ